MNFSLSVRKEHSSGLVAINHGEAMATSRVI